MGRTRACGFPRERPRFSAQPPHSLVSPLLRTGESGCRVTIGSETYALSNNHVYADEGHALIGDHVLQPGAYDGGALPEDYLGSLADYVDINFSENASNVVDAAIALYY